MRQVWLTMIAAFGMLAGTQCASAAPITWTFTGTADFQVAATGDLAGAIALGDTYVVKYTFGDSPSCPNPQVCFYSANTVTVELSINGMTFKVNPPSPLGYAERIIKDVNTVYEGIQTFERDYTVQHAGGGNASSSLARDALIDISFYVNAYGTSHLLASSAWPDTFDFNAFKAASPTDHSALAFTFTSDTGTLGISDGHTAFQTFSQSTPTDTPAPGALALLGTGLLGLVTARRERKRA